MSATQCRVCGQWVYIARETHAAAHTADRARRLLAEDPDRDTRAALASADAYTVRMRELASRSTRLAFAGIVPTASDDAQQLVTRARTAERVDWPPEDAPLIDY